MRLCVARPSHPELWDRLVTHRLAVLSPIHAASTCSPALAARVQGWAEGVDRVEGRVERWPGMSRMHGTDCSRRRVDIRHHRGPRA